MLETLSEMSVGKEKNTKEMRNKGEIIAEEQKNDEYYVYELSNSFLDNKPFSIDDPSKISPEIRYIIERAQKAAEIIDQI